MHSPLQHITEVYNAMETGNIGKLITILSNPIHVYTAHCMGGNSFGREGILRQISTFYRPGAGISKTVAHLIEKGHMVIALGTICISSSGQTIETMPFADVWSFEEEKISGVVCYYRDAEQLCTHLSKV